MLDAEMSQAGTGPTAHSFVFEFLNLPQLSPHLPCFWEEWESLIATLLAI
jgi:hypothetical protein